MRGRPNSSAVARAKARAHAQRVFYCACGIVVRGNGGRRHFERGGEHRRISQDQWVALRAEQLDGEL